jgi:hypothetical protein
VFPNEKCMILLDVDRVLDRLGVFCAFPRQAGLEQRIPTDGIQAEAISCQMFVVRQFVKMSGRV